MTEFEILKKRVKDLEDKLNMFIYPDRYQFQRTIAHNGQMLGFYGEAPIVQPTQNTTTVGHYPIGGAAVGYQDQFTGPDTAGARYSINGMVEELKDLGILGK